MKPIEQIVAGYITTVPDHHDRIVWRGRYYHLDALRTAPEGMVMVPREPTQEMLLANRAAPSCMEFDRFCPSCTCERDARTTYHAMLAAAENSK